jgi:hypothetical protein
MSKETSHLGRERLNLKKLTDIALRCDHLSVSCSAFALYLKRFALSAQCKTATTARALKAAAEKTVKSPC